MYTNMLNYMREYQMIRNVHVRIMTFHVLCIDFLQSQITRAFLWYLMLVGKYTQLMPIVYRSLDV